MASKAGDSKSKKENGVIKEMQKKRRNNPEVSSTTKTEGEVCEVKDAGEGQEQSTEERDTGQVWEV